MLHIGQVRFEIPIPVVFFLIDLTPVDLSVCLYENTDNTTFGGASWINGEFRSDMLCCPRSTNTITTQVEIKTFCCTTMY
jgi:hypothetical protein